MVDFGKEADLDELLKMPERSLYCHFLLLMSLLTTGCQTMVRNDIPDRRHPSNERPWSPQVSLLPRIELDDTISTPTQDDLPHPDAEVVPATYSSLSTDVKTPVRIHNVRNNRYITEEDFIAKYEQREYDLAKIRGVDLIVCPVQKRPYLANSILSFEFGEGEFLAVFAEVRTEIGESFSPALGTTNQFEIAYVLADEKDVLRLRTRHQNSEIFIYPTTATPDQARMMFIDVMKRVNRLEVRPEFYHTALNNCTSNILQHLNALNPAGNTPHFSVLLPGLAARSAYQQGILDQSQTFEKLKIRCQATELSNEFYDDPDYSLRIRRRITPIE